MESSVVEIAVALIGGGGIGTLILAIVGRRKNAAETRKVEVRGELQIVDSALELAQQLRSEVNEHKKRLDELEAENKLLDQQVCNLDKQVCQMQEENHALEKSVVTLKGQNEALSRRCTDLETENERLRRSIPAKGL